MMMFSILKKLKFLILIEILNISIILAQTPSHLAPCFKSDNFSYILDTNNGKIKGSCNFVIINDALNRTRGTNVYSWLAIPYAEPPVGPYRFKPPLPKLPWNDIIDGTMYPNSCYQYENQYFSEAKDLFSGFKMWLPSKNYTQMSEDCLKLNLWLPAAAYRNMNSSSKSNNTQRIPIMIFIHGSSGTTALDIYNPSVFVASTGIIVVQISFRSGIFGFLSLDDEVQGNQAILDQHLAFRWVYDNAESFGGDPNRITLLGTSYGAMQLGYHLVYKNSWPLFRNVILQGGSPLSDKIAPLSKIEANYRARDFLISLGCGDSTTSNAELIECARRHEPKNIIKELNRFFNEHLLRNNSKAAHFGFFLPVIDGEVISESIEDAIKNGNVKKCPILTGFAQDEGSMFIAYSGLFGIKASSIKQKSNINFSTINQFISELFQYYPRYPSLSYSWLHDNILYHYTTLTNEDNSESPLLRPNYFHTLSRLISDESFVCPAIKFAEAYSQHENDVYFYVYSHRISTSPWPYWYGVAHSDELAMVFGQPISSRLFSSAINANPWLAPKYGYNQAEKRLANDIMAYWANFIKYNNPNMYNNTHALLSKKWPSFRSITPKNTIKDRFYLILKTNASQVSRNYALETCQLWNKLMPKLLEEQNRLISSLSQVQTTCPVQTTIATTVTETPTTTQTSMTTQNQSIASSTLPSTIFITKSTSIATEQSTILLSTTSSSDVGKMAASEKIKGSNSSTRFIEISYILLLISLSTMILKSF